MTTSRSEASYDVVVIGAGPAGLAAAAAASEQGARTALLDAGTAPGGQYWRHPAPTGRLDGEAAQRWPAADERSALHHDLGDYVRLVDRLPALEANGGRYLPDHHVWTVARDDGGDAARDNEGALDGVDDVGIFAVRAVDRSGRGERQVVVRGRRLVLAPGAYDRQVPFPGWDLPGVMTAGGVQSLLKGHDVVAGHRVVVAGTGPFLLPVAAGLAGAGARVVGVHEASSPLAWARHGVAVARNPGKLVEGARYAAVLARHRVPVATRSVVVAASGGETLEQVTAARVDVAGRVVEGSRRTVAADILAVGWGFTPQLELPMAVGCRTRVDADGSTVCVVDSCQQSSVEGVYVAGEACGVGGAALAVVEGEIAGAAAGGKTLQNRRLLRRREALRLFAQAIQAAHPVHRGWVDRLDEDTVVCRCEEVTVGRLREAAADWEVDDARTAKLMTRVGMGWCQGRVCGYSTAEILAAWSGDHADGVPQRAVERPSERPIASPFTLGSLASPDTET